MFWGMCGIINALVMITHPTYLLLPRFFFCTVDGPNIVKSYLSFTLLV